MTQQPATRRREPLPASPGAPARVRAQPPGAAPPGTRRRAGRSGGALGIVRWPRAARASPKRGARGAGRGRGAGLAARGGRERGAAAGARDDITAGCGSAGARTWLRRRRRRRAAPRPERPAPSRGAPVRAVPEAPGQAPRGSRGHRGLPLLQPPWADCWGGRRQGAPRSQGENRKALAVPPAPPTPRLPAPPPRGWGFGGCSPVSYCWWGVPRTRQREPREGPALGIGTPQAREAQPPQAPLNWERSGLQTPTVHPQTWCSVSAEKWALGSSWILAFTVNPWLTLRTANVRRFKDLGTLQMKGVGHWHVDIWGEIFRRNDNSELPHSRTLPRLIFAAAPSPPFLHNQPTKSIL
jgi:hypothetical protein